MVPDSLYLELFLRSAQYFFIRSLTFFRSALDIVRRLGACLVCLLGDVERCSCPNTPSNSSNSNTSPRRASS